MGIDTSNEALLGCWDIDDPALRARVEKMLDGYREQYGEPTRGLGRAVFSDHERHLVFKVPLNWFGRQDNSREAAWDREDAPIAPCRLLDEGDWPVLEMEMVDIDVERPCLPDWTCEFDDAQVGYTSDGQLVLYDL